jgi:hypothetical protein
MTIRYCPPLVVLVRWELDESLIEDKEMFFVHLVYAACNACNVCSCYILLIQVSFLRALVD